MHKDLTIPRGKNVGRTIKAYLIDNKLYNKVKIITFDVKRDKAAKTVTASITYNYK